MKEQWPREESDDFSAARNLDRNLQQRKSKGITKTFSLRDDGAATVSHQMRSSVKHRQGECRQPRESSRQKRLPNDQVSKPVERDPPPLTTEGSLADHFAVHKARARKGATSQLRHDLYAKVCNHVQYETVNLRRNWRVCVNHDKNAEVIFWYQFVGLRI
jgi:hypothetical protein